MNWKVKDEIAVEHTSPVICQNYDRRKFTCERVGDEPHKFEEDFQQVRVSGDAQIITNPTNIFPIHGVKTFGAIKIMPEDDVDVIACQVMDARGSTRSGISTGINNVLDCF